MKTKTRILSMLLAIAMLFSVMAGVNLSAFAATSGDYEYVLLDDGAVAITGYNGNATKLTIPSKIAGKTVTEIGWNAFSDCTSLISVTISNSVELIGEGAFRNCPGLTNITIPNSVTSIGWYAFYGCTNLASIAIPNSVTSIGWYAFSKCTGLTSIILPNSVTSIERYVFSECTGLTSIAIPNGVISIEAYAFYGCISLNNIAIPNSVTSLNAYAFNNTGYYNNKNNWNNDVLYIGNRLIEAKDDIQGKYTIKSRTVTIAGDAFSKCTGLTSITIPSSVTSIGTHAFYGCTSLKNIEIPNSVISIGACAFEGCTGLTDITIPNSVTSIEGETFAHTDLTSITIPNSVKSIGNSAFSDCTGLTSITIPNSVTSIGNYAFDSCTDLTSIAIWNASAKIENWAIHEEATIYGYPNSTAKTYAEKYGNKFVDITTVKPTAPTAKYAVNADRTFTISWNNVAGADKYEIYSYNSSTGTYKYVKTTTELSYTTGKAAFGTTYKYKIRAVNSANNAKSAYCTVTAVNNKYLPAPSATYAVNSDRTFTISWNNVAGADKYEIYSYNSSTGTYKYVKTTTELSYTTGKAAFGTTYKYKIRAVCSTNNVKSGYCTVSAVNNKYLPTPAGKFAVNSDRTFTISWGKVTGADKYEIYSYNASTGTYKYVKTTTELSHKTGKAAFGTTYKYKIRAVNSANNVKSGYCTISAVNNQYLPATTAKFAVNSDCTLTISWAKVTGADKYEIYSYNASTGTYKYVKTTTALSHKTGAAPFGTTYKYKIRAVNSANNVKSAYCTVSAVNDKKLTTPTAKVTVNTNGTFTISWGKVTGATKYEVYIFDSKLNDYRLSRTSTGTSITTGTASKGVTYKYKVRAITSKDTSATSDFSAVVTGKR